MRSDASTSDHALIGPPPGERRRAVVVALIAALAMLAGVAAAIVLRTDGQSAEELSLSAAAGVTSRAGSARVTIRTGSQGDTPLLQLSGPVDFSDGRFQLTGKMNGKRVELRGIGTDRWTRQDTAVGGKTWLHATDIAASDSGLGSAEPSQLLDRLTHLGTPANRRRDGDRAVWTLTTRGDALGMPPAAASIPVEVTVEADADGRLREVSYSYDGNAGTRWTGTTTYSDFGTPVEVQAPPANDVVDVAGLIGSQLGDQDQKFKDLGGTGSDSCAILEEYEKEVAAHTSERNRATMQKFIADIRAACSGKH
jgi:hypothetical protein